MSDFVIISDSACDLGSELRKKFSVDDIIYGYIVYPDGSQKHTDMDWEHISPEDYYKMISNKNIYIKTAQPSPGEIAEVFERHLAKGKDILAIFISTGISGIYGSACAVAEDLREKYPDRKIICIDSLRYSTCLSLLCIYAAMMRNAGKSLEETAEWVNENKNCIHQMGTIEDLFFCKRMGRVSNTAAIMGTLVGIKPLADFNSKGLSHVIGKTRGYTNLYNCIIGYMKKTIINPEKQIIFVAHTARTKEAEKLKKMIEKEFKPKECIITWAGQNCGTSIGPGLIAAFYYGKEISENMEEEKKIIAELA